MVSTHEYWPCFMEIPLIIHHVVVQVKCFINIILLEGLYGFLVIKKQAPRCYPVIIETYFYGEFLAVSAFFNVFFFFFYSIQVWSFAKLNQLRIEISIFPSVCSLAWLRTLIKPGLN